MPGISRKDLGRLRGGANHQYGTFSLCQSAGVKMQPSTESTGGATAQWPGIRFAIGVAGWRRKAASTEKASCRVMHEMLTSVRYIKQKREFE